MTALLLGHEDLGSGAGVSGNCVPLRRPAAAPSPRRRRAAGPPAGGDAPGSGEQNAVADGPNRLRGQHRGDLMVVVLFRCLP